MHRRSFLQTGSAAVGALTLAGCTTATTPRPRIAFDPTVVLHPMRADNARILKVTVCTRPFRAAGPRLELERVGDKIVVHNYGHGGSGWSLSWGYANLAVEQALATGQRDLAVLGCGALGLTAALTAQRNGAHVTIYAKDLPAETRSANATGTWSPDSRVALQSAVTPAFEQRWESIARSSFRTHLSLLGVEGAPVEWVDRYILSDEPWNAPNDPTDGPDFAELRHLIRGLAPQLQEVEPGTHPFPVPYVKRNASLQFNVTSLQHRLVQDFLAAGGKIERREFHAPSELAKLKQKTIINCTGYGARALWRDESVIPVRGQLTWLLPQAEVRYGVIYHDMIAIPRSDGIIVQRDTEATGFNNPDTTPDRAEAERAVASLAELMGKMRTS
ncbi:FAD-dependent oxidoreductase [Roseiterribacter gracilis]|uniref:D-amino-acid oxidase n=1 Tax=Roseiterribacter gracilis TaxID=2812848 RepID=A0A8S8XEZ4_9PROT|nr:D-amino-acid oxidase [Rhodospirillales bacterium TMPK1]